jgi:hypothetical protein
MTKCPKTGGRVLKINALALASLHVRRQRLRDSAGFSRREDFWVIEPHELRMKLTAMADEVAEHHRSRVLRA